MTQLLGYELKKILKRPLTLFVLIGCLVVLAFIDLYGATQGTAYVWGPEKYGSYEAIPQKELDKAHERYGLTGKYDGTLVYTSLDSWAIERELTRPFEGVWDDARLAEMAAGYQAFKNDPANYTDELDTTSMQLRRWSFLDQGMTEAEVDAYDATNPIRVMKPEVQYGEEWRGWSTISQQLDDHILRPDGTAKAFSEAFPLVEQPAEFSYSKGPSSTVEAQSGVGILIALAVLAGVAPIFCDEVSQNTEPMLLAAKHGRGKLVWAKLLAGALYALGVVACLALLNVLLIALTHGTEGWTMPVQLDWRADGVPFSVDFIGNMLITVGYQALSAVATACLLMLLSSAFRSAFPVLFAGGVYVLMVTIFATQSSPVPFNYIAQALPAGTFIPVSLIYFGKMSGLDFLPLPQWSMPILVGAAVILLCPLLVARRYRKKRE